MTVMVERGDEGRKDNAETQSSRRKRGEDGVRHGRWVLGVIEFLR